MQLVLEGRVVDLMFFLDIAFGPPNLVEVSQCLISMLSGGGIPLCISIRLQIYGSNLDSCISRMCWTNLGLLEIYKLCNVKALKRDFKRQDGIGFIWGPQGVRVEQLCLSGSLSFTSLCNSRHLVCRLCALNELTFLNKHQHRLTVSFGNYWGCHVVWSTTMRKWSTPS